MNIHNERGPGFVLASLLAAYPDATFFGNTRCILEDEKLNSQKGLAFEKTLEKICIDLKTLFENSDRYLDLQSEYIDTFDRGKQVSSLYETEYGRERALVKGNELVDIAGFYNAFGFQVGGEGVQPEMLDHVSVELEFYALLVLKTELLAEKGDLEGVEIVLEGRKKFLKAHLGRFVGAIRQRPGVQASRFYSLVFQFCDELIEAECFSLDIQPIKEDWVSGDSALAEMTCGGSVGCTK